MCFWCTFPATKDGPHQDSDGALVTEMQSCQRAQHPLVARRVGGEVAMSVEALAESMVGKMEANMVEVMEAAVMVPEK